MSFSFTEIRPRLDRILGGEISAFRKGYWGWELCAIIILAGLTIGRNVLFSVHGLGEQDAARLLNDAHFWRLTGWLPFVDYTDKTSPAWIWMLKNLLVSGVPDNIIIRSLNIAAAFAGLAVVILAYLIARRLAGVPAALMAAMFIAVSPAVAVFSLYGFPTIFAFAGFLVSVLLVDRMMECSGRGWIAYGLAACAALACASSIKADIVVLSGAYLGLAILRGRLDYRTIVALAVILTVGAAAPLIFKQLFLPETAHTVVVSKDYARTWDDRFPFSFGQLLSRENLSITGRASGYVLTMLALTAGVLATVEHRSRRVAILLMLWAVPVILFWGGRPGNSARHLLGTTFPISFAAAFIIDRIRCRLPRGAGFGLAIGAVGLNYISTPASVSSVAPSTRLIESALMLNSHVNQRMTFGRSIVSNGSERIYLIDSFTQPYSMYNILNGAKSLQIIQGSADSVYHDGAVRIVHENGRTIDLAWKSAGLQDANRLAREANQMGWTVYSIENAGLPGQVDGSQ